MWYARGVFVGGVHPYLRKNLFHKVLEKQSLIPPLLVCPHLSEVLE